jgi:predicted nucleic acid-binding protein
MVGPEAVVNASPLIHLAKINKLHLLNSFFASVYIPKAVIAEIQGLDISNLSFITLDIKNRLMVNALLGKLHLGEVEVIAGAVECNANYAVLDDYAGRKKAEQLGISVVGTLGILQKANKMGMVADLAEDIQVLQNAGMYLTDDLVRRILT